MPEDKTTNPAAPKNAREFQVWEDGRQQGHREAQREIKRLRDLLQDAGDERDTFWQAMGEACENGSAPEMRAILQKAMQS